MKNASAERQHFIPKIDLTIASPVHSLLQLAQPVAVANAE